MAKKESSSDQGWEIWDQDSPYNCCSDDEAPKEVSFQVTSHAERLLKKRATGCLLQQTPSVPSTAATYSLPRSGRIACDPGNSTSACSLGGSVSCLTIPCLWP